MKKLFYFVQIVIPFLLIQCSNETPNSVDQLNLELGKVSLRIDKLNAPSNVVLVEAYLSNEGHDTLYGALNILSSTSADIFFDEVAAGEWYLKVDAKDADGTVLYTGETEMTVRAGILTQVNLVLTPTGLGTGYIYILVSWGQDNTSWIDFPENPVLTRQDSYYDQNGISQPAIIKEDNHFKMWYAGAAVSGIHYVLYAESNDGINWTQNPEPVLSPGPQESWDSWAVHPGAVIKDGNVYRMYYSGWADQYGEWHVGLATSTDGINWQKYPSPVLYGTTGWETRIVPTSILKINGMYYLYYYGSMINDNKIGLATSSDGINWTKYASNPVLKATQSWEGTGIYHPSIIEDRGIYKMVYMNKASDAIGMATSTDGIYWGKKSDNPFFTKENTANNWADEDISYPFYIKIGNEYRIYYSGIGDPGSIIYSIGFIRKIGN